MSGTCMKLGRHSDFGRKSDYSSSDYFMAHPFRDSSFAKRK